MPDPNKIAELFLRVLFDWDTPETDGLWKTIVSISPNPKDPNRPFTPNVAAGRMDDVLRCIGQRRGRRSTNNYICMSTARNIREGEFSNDGFPRIARRAENAVTIKALYVDVDVGKSGAYQTTADAELGLRKFLADSGMPEPTMIVYTGSGGFHVYWCFDRPMTIAEWRPLAEALKTCTKHHGFLTDAMVTADPVRIMRLPTTFNHKSGVPVECVLKLDSSFDLYRKDNIEQILKAHMVAPRQAGPTQAQASAGPAPVSGLGQNFTAGVNEGMPPVPIDAVAAVCPTTADILARAGAGVADPLWKLSLLMATFTTDPKDAAHRMSSGWAEGNKAYDPIETDKALQDKLDARARNPKLGWPSCSQFHAYHASCNTCPFLQAGKTPFHWVNRGAQPQPTTAKVANDPLMPEGYWRNVNDHVFTQTENGPIDIIGYPIIDGGVNADTGTLAVKYSVSGRIRWGDVAVAKQTPTAMCEAWTVGTNNDIVIRGPAQALKVFTMAWLQHLQKQDIKQQPVGFGWHGDTFVFGDQRYTPAGPETAYRGNTIDKKFDRVGKLDAWTDALRLVQGNTPLEIVVASAFAAPLVKLSCDYSVVLSIYSHQSGYHKTTAMRLAQAVWGNPDIAMSSLDDTVNSVTKKMGDLRHLPIYWDELKTKEQTERIVQVVFTATQGKGKQRLKSDASYAPVGEFRTLFAVASNHGIAGPVIRSTEGTEAGGIRVFELEAQTPQSTMGTNESNQMMIKLGDNYGVAGAVFADYIVRHKADCEAVVMQIWKQLQIAHNFSQKERVWHGAMSTIIAGAYLANQAGLVDFDVSAIAHCMGDRLAELRNNLAATAYTLTSATAASDVLAEMQGELRGKNMIETPYVPLPGRQRPMALDAPFADPNRLGDVWMQHGLTDGRILVRIRPFNTWLVKNNYSPEQVMQLLRKEYNVLNRRATIGAGVQFLQGAQAAPCYDLTPKKKKVPTT